VHKNTSVLMPYRINLYDILCDLDIGQKDQNIQVNKSKIKCKKRKEQ